MWRIFRVFVLVTSVMVAGAETFVGTAHVATRDFLAAYRGIAPGEQLDDAEAERCDLHVGMTAGVETKVCRFDAEDGVFGRVTVIETDHVIRRLAFEVKPDALLLGELILCWGKPTRFEAMPAVAEGMHTTTRWDNRVYIGHSVIRRGGYPNYFLPMTYLSLEKEGLSCASGE